MARLDEESGGRMSDGELFIKSNGSTAKVELFGKDISNKLQGVLINMCAGALPKVTLDVVPTENCVLDINRAIVEVIGGKATNANRIRTMTDEELAKFIYITEPPWCTHIDTCGADDDCRDCLLKWLKEEVEHDC